MRGRVPLLIAAAAVFATSVTGLLGPSPSAAAAAPTATTVLSIQRVGALFVPSVFGSSLLLGLPHECSGSVVHSPGHDLVLTAAHCILGSGVGYDFVPGYHDGVAPFGIWTVQHAYVDPSWTAHQDPQHDYAFLRVARQPWRGHPRNIEDVTGAYALGTAPPAGSTVTVDGYVAGSGDRPITCTGQTYRTAGYPSFDCAGFAAGTSGGPWLSGSTVVGVTGGLHQGGCVATTSYSAAFGAGTLATWQRAAARGTPNFVPLAGSSGCPAA